MEYVYQIKLITNEFSFSRPTVAQGIVIYDNKKAVLGYLESEYPEYFDGNKVSQKLSKKSEQIVYVSIYELNDYWRKYWTQEIECTICHKRVPLIQIRNYLGNININKFACCVECEEIRVEQSKNEIDDYWNDRCQYYYIYKISNKKNGKVYVGYTEREPIFRWWEHFKHSHLPIGEALKEFGIESFTFEVLEQHAKTEKSIDEMHEIETKYIVLFDSIKSGYNCIVSKLT